MSHFAKIELTETPGIFKVVNVIVAEQDFIDQQPGVWIQTSYNTWGNVHYAPSPPAEPNTPDGLPPLRGNYAGIGFTYDQINDVFIPPKPTEGEWVLDTNTWLWVEVNP